MKPLWCSGVLIALLSTAPPTHAVQPQIDLTRLWLQDSTIFAPFQVTETHALSAKIDDGTLTGDTRVLVLEHPAGRLAFVTNQIAYHHVAQGELAGEPWMVSF